MGGGGGVTHRLGTIVLEWLFCITEVVIDQCLLKTYKMWKYYISYDFGISVKNGSLKSIWYTYKVKTMTARRHIGFSP